MGERLRVGVVGAGVIGCASAFELARRGADVVVFDARSPGGGATQASAGILAPFIEGHDSGPLLQLGTSALSLYDQFVDDLRSLVDTPFEYRRNGTLEIAETAARADILRSRAAAAPSAVGAEWLGASQLAALEPAITDRQDGALLCRAHGFIAVMPFVSALVRAAERLGAVFHSRAAVRSIRTHADSCEIQTQAGSFIVDRVLLSLGSWASSVDPFDEIRGAVKPIKGQLIVVNWPGPPLSHVLWGTAAYLVPWEDGALLVGATSEDVGFDERPTVEGVSGLTVALREMLPGAGAATFREVRVGLRPARLDGLPLVASSSRDSRVVYATGHFRNGVLLAPLTAKLVSSHLLSDQPVRDNLAPNGV